MGRNAGGVTSNGRTRGSANSGMRRRLNSLIKKDEAKLKTAESIYQKHVGDYMFGSQLKDKKIAKSYATKMMSHNGDETPQTIKLRINKYKKLLSKYK